MGARLSKLEQPQELDPKKIELMTGCFDQVVRTIPSRSGSEEFQLVIYKGFLEDHGTKLEVLVECGRGEFKNRMAAMWCPHPNIVRLIGFCKSPFLHALVMPLETRGCLKDMVLGGNLAWKHRVKIIKGVALALGHLHDAKNSLGFQVLHLDVRMENVWVSQDYTPKLAGFHSCKIKRGISDLTDKVDVYRFGIVLLEIISGREIQSDPDCRLEIEKSIDLDPRIEDVPKIQAKRMIELSRMCLQNDEKSRTSMDELVKRVLLWF